jgi:hypothetical protein
MRRFLVLPDLCLLALSLMPGHSAATSSFDHDSSASCVTARAWPHTSTTWGDWAPERVEHVKTPSGATHPIYL